MVRSRFRVFLAVALVVFCTVGSARAETIKLRPTTFGEFVDQPPIDGAGLRLELGENVALGPLSETRVFYEFSLAGLTVDPTKPVVFAVTRRDEAFSLCSGLAPCPDLTGFDVYGYAGDGAITTGDYDAGTLLSSITAIPSRGGLVTVDVTLFLTTLIEGGASFSGFALRPASQGALGFENATLAAVPEPSTLALVATATVGYVTRRWRRRERTKVRKCV